MLRNRTIVSIFLLFISVSLTAQTGGSPKSLLWRISGNGLQKPSYLYGTMHLSDKRLFKFGDSVYHAIEQSEGLAIEVNPDELAAYYVNRLFDQMEKGKKLTDIVKRDDLKKYNTALAKKFNKPAADITAADIVKEKNKWMADYMEKGEMPTFVDAYLYNIARRQGKWLGGIEDIADQDGLLEDMVDESDIQYLLANDNNSRSKEIDKSLEYMVSLYSNQDIDGIEMLSSQGSAEKRERMLTRRNIKMARRIDSLTGLRSMFLAIGAAHLPGNDGVIALLRARGFNVEPVFSSRKLDETAYTFKEVSLPWYPVTDAQQLYQASMPGNPASVKLYGLMEMKFLMDIFSMTAFCTMAVPSAGDLSVKDSSFDILARRMMQSDNINPPKLIYNDGIEGKEYAQEKKGANIRLQVFSYKKVVYLSFMSSMKPASLFGPVADKFFSSLIINKNQVRVASSSVFADSVMGIRFRSPAPIVYSKKLSSEDDNGWHISAFAGSDPVTGCYVAVYSKEVSPNHYVPSDSVIFTDFDNNIGKQYIVISREEQPVKGLASVKITGRNKQQPSFYITTLNMLQNGRDIVLMAITDSAHLHHPSIDSIFSSLQLLPHPFVNWQIREDSNKLFSSYLPSPLKTYLYLDDRKKQFYSFDSSTATTYSIIPDTLSAYSWSESDSAFWARRIAYNRGTDSLLQQVTVSNAGMPGVDLLLREQGSSSRYKRMRLLLDGNKLYKLFASAEKDFLYSKTVNEFFNAFKIASPDTDNKFYTRRKTALLLKDLLGSDSASRSQAYYALGDAPFTDTGRAALEDAVFKQYRSVYDTSFSSTINNELGRQLAKLKSPATIGFIKERYGSFTDRKDEQQSIALNILASMPTKESYTVLAELLQAPPRDNIDFRLTGPLQDSLALTATIYPALQKLAGDTLYASSVAFISNKLYDSGFVTIDQVKQALPAFIQSAGQLLPRLRRGDLEDYYIYQLVTLLGNCKTAGANAMLTKYLSVQSSWLQKTTAIALLKNKQPVPATLLTKLAADKEMRYQLYTDLEEIGQKKRFPATYLTQSYFAEAAAFNAAADDEDYGPSSMHFLYKKTAVYKKKTYTFYLYRMVYDGDEPTAYLGIAGGYAVDGTGLQPAEELSGIYREATLDKKNSNAAALLAAFLKQYQDTAEERAEEE